MDFVSFASIEGFHNVVKYVHKYVEGSGPIVYRGKIKIHGTNAGIRISHGDVKAQSRNRFVTPDDDNVGFAAWVETNAAYWGGLMTDGVVFGEWCGPGIMNGTAINDIPQRIFAVFSLLIRGIHIYDPETISKILSNRPHDVHVLPWQTGPLTVDFTKRETLPGVVDFLNLVVNEVESGDPWVKSVFGVQGVGEGLVYYPQSDSVETFKHFAFKAKGEKHRVKKAKVAVEVDPEVAANLQDFVAMFVTGPRMEQGLAAVGGVAEMKHMRAFLDWGLADIRKECLAELEASDLQWDQVQKPVTSAVRDWFLAKSKAI